MDCSPEEFIIPSASESSTQNTSRVSCFVPGCPSNSIKYPNKIFLTVPREPNCRKLWMQAVKRDDLSPKSIVRCCEDHFDMENDIENWVKYKLVGCPLYVKKGIVPHIFKCEKTVLKSKLSSDELKCGRHNVIDNIRNEQDSNEENQGNLRDKCIEISIYPHKRSKRVQTPIKILTNTVTVSPNKVLMKDQRTSPLKLNTYSLMYTDSDNDSKKSYNLETEGDSAKNSSTMPETRSYVCQTCLRTESELWPLATLSNLLREIRLWELKSTTGGVCMECMQIMTNFNRFREQVQRVQDTLHDVKVNEIKIESTKSISLEESEHTNPLFNFMGDQTLNDETEKLEQIKNEPSPDFEDINPDSGDKNNESPMLLELETVFVESLGGIEVDKCKQEISEEAQHRKTRKSRRKSDVHHKTYDVENKEKFLIVELTEEEMQKRRETKKQQPRYQKMPYRCDMCVQGFTKKEKFDIHVKKSHDNMNDGKFPCPVCSVRFATAPAMSEHRREHYVVYKCKYCKFTSDHAWTAWGHCRKKHPGSDGPTRRRRRDAALGSSLGSVQVEIDADHSVCERCGESFKSRNAMLRHIGRAHAAHREFACDVCNRTFKSKGRLEAHAASHSAALAARLAYCALCRVQYKNIYVYRSHLKNSVNHAQEKFQCTECDSSFSSKVYWKKHYNFYHLQKSQYNCEKCDMIFISKWRLKRHKQLYHGLTRPRNYACNVCGKQFFSKSTLSGHQLTHSEERTFMCEDCGDTFKQRPALYTHTKLVHERVKRRAKRAQ